MRKLVGEFRFDVTMTHFLRLHLVFNLELIAQYFPSLLNSLEVAKKLAPIELNPNYIKQVKLDHIMDINRNYIFQ